VLDGHALMLQLSHNTKKSGDSDSRASAVKKVDKKESSTKIIVRNVAFEATRKDLQQLFNPFGQIKSVRLPKKFDGNHRGFAFVEFITRQEAQNAFEALQSTHLYGRHLVRYLSPYSQV
jgi:multiple RNA-binding domain-containing protein 1